MENFKEAMPMPSAISFKQRIFGLPQMQAITLATADSSLQSSCSSTICNKWT